MMAAKILEIWTPSSLVDMFGTDYTQPNLLHLILS